MKTVLVVDDDKEILKTLKMILEYAKFEVAFAENGPDALSRIGESVFDLVLLDIKMAGMDGLTALEKIKALQPELPVVMISGHGTIETAVEATKLGAYDFLQKPLDRDKLLIVARNAVERKRLMTDYKEIREKAEGRTDILGESPKIKEVIAQINRVAPTEAKVLITGENGSGKELVAKAIQRQSKRSDKPFVEVNCAAIPNELIESELFGHEKGAFTGAASQRIGKFELADGGTIFLDEIGDMNLNAQAKVLRVLEEGKLERVGGNKQIAVDVRVIAATNHDLLEAIKQGTFREDLYHRVNVIPIIVPPLRERREDIPTLAVAFAEDICIRNGMPPVTFIPDALQRLKQLEWRGNVRELRNIVERLVIMTPHQTIEASQIERGAGVAGPPSDDLLGSGGTFQDFKDRAEAAYIRKQLEEHSW
ncbi:MAG: sigma-54 dependent transcriptional regulator, partial [Ignavibacteria bacterium]|nr:sigma-54 dependent transcriptional regulator [Ignavibacteria bacterium]